MIICIISPPQTADKWPLRIPCQFVSELRRKNKEKKKKRPFPLMLQAQKAWLREECPCIGPSLPGQNLKWRHAVKCTLQGYFLASRSKRKRENKKQTLKTSGNDYNQRMDSSSLCLSRGNKFDLCYCIARLIFCRKDSAFCWDWIPHSLSLPIPRVLTTCVATPQRPLSPLSLLLVLFPPFQSFYCKFLPTSGVDGYSVCWSSSNKKTFQDFTPYSP